MADEQLFGEIGGQIVGKLFGGVLWFGIAIIIIGILGFVMYYFLVYKRKFDIKVKIQSQRAADKHAVIFDKAAILLDWKTKAPYFKIWGLKREFPVPKYNVLQSSNEGDYLEMYRESEDSFYFLFPPRIDRKRIIRSDGKAYAFSGQDQTAFDPELSHWIVSRIDQNKNMFDVGKVWMKLLPYIPHIVGGVLTIFILYILLDHLPTILSALQNLAVEMNKMQTANIKTG